jgi:hypothetical protein
MKKALLAFAAFALLPGGILNNQAHSNPLMSKNAIVQRTSSVQLTASEIKKMIEKLKKKFTKKKPVRKSRYKTCGTYFYRDTKTGKCVDAR